MKPILPLLALMLVSITSSAQYQYAPIPTDSAVWNYYSRTTTAGIEAKTNFHIIIKNEDTIINGISYKKMFYRYAESIKSSQYPNVDTPIPNKANQPDSYYGGIREDNKRVYVKMNHASDTVDRMVYDFNLGVGDTLADNYGNSGATSRTYNYVIDRIDTIVIGGKTRKRFIAYGFDTGVTDFNDSAIAIEGIGSNNGLLRYYDVIKSSYEFRCHAAPGIVYEINNPCIYTYEYGTPTTINSTNNTQPVKVYPNPVYDAIHIQSDNAATVTLYNTVGQVVHHTAMQPTISMSPFPTGSYILILRDKDKNLIHKQLLIKQ